MTPRTTAPANAERQRQLVEQVSADSAALVASSSDAIVGMMLDRSITSWNAGAERLYGYTRDEAIGRSINMLAVAGQLDEAERIRMALMHGEPVLDLDTWRRHRDGSIVAVSVSVSPVRDEHGAVVGAVGIHRDIGVRKAVESRTRELTELLDLSHDAVIIRDPVSSAVTYWNRGAELLYGWSAREAAGRVTHELLATIFPRSQEATAERLERDGEWLGELTHAARDGRAVVVESRQVLRRDATGRPAAILEINRDITERKRAEEALRFLSAAGAVLASSLDYEVTLQTTANLIVPSLADWCTVDLVEDDRSIRRVAVAHRSPAMEKRLHELAQAYPPDQNSTQIIGTAVRTGRPAILEDITDAQLIAAATSEDHLALLRALSPCASVAVPLQAGGCSLGALTAVSTVPGFHYDPATVTLLATVAQRAAIAIDSARLYQAALQARQDAARAQQRTQRALDGLLRLAETLVAPPDEPEETAHIESSDSGLLRRRLVEVVGEVLACRSVALITLMPQTSTIRSVSLFAPDSFAAQVWLIYREGADLRTCIAVAACFDRLCAGEALTLDVAAPAGGDVLRDTARAAILCVPLRLGNELAGVLGVLPGDAAHGRGPDPLDLALATGRLVTLVIERERLQHLRAESIRLREREQLQSSFLGMISHELRTPLTAAQAGLGLLELGAGDRLAAADRNLLSTIRRNTHRLGALIEDLLTLTKLDSGVLRLEASVCDLNDAVEAAVSMVEPLLQEKGQTVRLDLPAALVVRADQRRLEQVVANLLANVHRHAPAGTTVRISGNLTEKHVALDVCDNGPGIPREQLEHIFERFERAGSTAGGTGLGLAIARGLVELHCGRIWAESPRDRGAEFHIVLPRDGVPR